MKKVTLREYAKLHKLSFFSVVKMVRNHELRSELVIEEGKEMQYILLEDSEFKELDTSDQEVESPKMSLKEENILLKKEVQRLRKALEQATKR